MTTYALIINDEAINVSTNPFEDFHEGVASQFEEVDDSVVVGSRRGTDGHWVPPAVKTVPKPVNIPFLTPIQFKMCFTPEERRVINEFRKNDPILQDAYEILDDPRLTEVDLKLQSVKDTVKYIQGLGIINSERYKEILLGVIK